MSPVTPPQEEAPLIPILVDGSGRDGTTFTMRVLGTSREIAFDRIYPYEQRYLSYLMALSQVVEGEEWDRREWNHDHLATSSTWILDRGLIGPLPWRERGLLYGGSDARAPAWPALFEVLWGEFSRRARASVRAECGDPSQAVIYYAQKITAARRLDPEVLRRVKLVLLLRDPRDTWLSMVAFDERRRARGQPGFIPLAEGEAASDFLAEFIASQKARLKWISTQTCDSVVLRYEDLVLNLSAVTSRLSEWLGVELDPAAARGDPTWTGNHVTSPTPGESLERWRREMPPETAAVFARELGPELEIHGWAAR